MSEILNQSHSQQTPAPSFSMEIDGRIYTVRAFFKEAGSETLQQKIERMIHRDLLTFNPVVA